MSSSRWQWTAGESSQRPPSDIMQQTSRYHITFISLLLMPIFQDVVLKNFWTYLLAKWLKIEILSSITVLLCRLMAALLASLLVHTSTA